MIFGDAAKLAERFGQCQDVEEVWQAALEVFSVFGKCWISYGVSDYHQSKLYAYRNSGDTAFAEYYVKNNLRDIDCLFHHIRSSRETLCVSIGDIEDVDIPDLGLEWAAVATEARTADSAVTLARPRT